MPKVINKWGVESCVPEKLAAEIVSNGGRYVIDPPVDVEVGVIVEHNGPEAGVQTDPSELITPKEPEVEELEALRVKAKELGIQHTHLMKKDKLLEKIAEVEEQTTQGLNLDLTKETPTNQ